MQQEGLLLLFASIYVYYWYIWGKPLYFEESPPVIAVPGGSFGGFSDYVYTLAFNDDGHAPGLANLLLRTYASKAAYIFKGF